MIQAEAFAMQIKDKYKFSQTKHPIPRMISCFQFLGRNRRPRIPSDPASRWCISWRSPPGTVRARSRLVSAIARGGYGR